MINGKSDLEKREENKSRDSTCRMRLEDSKLKIKPVLPPAAVRPDTKRLKLEASWRLFLAVRCVIETSWRLFQTVMEVEARMSRRNTR